MALRLHVPLPGPFSYSTRIGGRGRRGPSRPLSTHPAAVVFMYVVVVGVMSLLAHWTGGIVAFLALSFMYLRNAAGKTAAEKN